MYVHYLLKYLFYIDRGVGLILKLSDMSKLKEIPIHIINRIFLGIMNIQGVLHSYLIMYWDRVKWVLQEILYFLI